MSLQDTVLGYVGRRVTLHLDPHATGAPLITGRLVAAEPAADGLIVTFEPDDKKPAARLTYHYHYIKSIELA